jgi:hypothetical protein
MMKMNKRVIIPAIILAAIVTAAVAQPIPVSIRKLHLIGEGLMINKDNFFDFSSFRIGVATVKARIDNETVNITRGIMLVEGEIYRLVVKEFTNDTFVADIYYNNSVVGSMSLNSVLKGDKIAWVGDASIGDKQLLVYILEFPRLFKPFEIREVVKEYCEKKPSECVGIGPNYCDKLEDHDCRVKIIRWCKEHIDDTRCKALAKEIGKAFPATSEGLSLQQIFQQQAQKSFCNKHPEACTQTLITRIVRRGR